MTGFVSETVKTDNGLFKSIKVAVTEYIGSGSTGNKLLSHAGTWILMKAMKAQKNSNVMVIGELTYLETEFVVELQDMNFYPCQLRMWRRLWPMGQPRREGYQHKKWRKGWPILPILPILLLFQTKITLMMMSQRVLLFPTAMHIHGDDTAPVRYNSANDQSIL